MRFDALATDYDGTIAEEGRVSSRTLGALARVKESGRKIILVTGREMGELRRVFPEVDVFDRVVAENGALLVTPSPLRERLLASPLPPELAIRLRERGAPNVAVGRVIVATWEPYEAVVLEAIRDLGLELEVIFNKGAVMVLPTGVNKASGLAAALEELGIDAATVVGVGDGENDHSLLKACGFGVAVANAVPALKELADLVMPSPRGEGVVELVTRLLDADDVHASRADASTLDMIASPK